MRLRSNVLRTDASGKTSWTDPKGGRALVSDETLKAMSWSVNDAPDQTLESTCALFIRKAGARATSGAMFLFSFPPQSMVHERSTNTSVTQTRGGYIVSENGLGSPTFTLQGHFGWKLRKVKLPDQIKVSIAPKSNAKQDQNLNNYWIPLPWVTSPNADQLFEKVIEGQNVSIIGFEQQLDGRQAFYALRDLIVFYLEENQNRLASGKAQLEMVWLDPLHNFRWVVSPKYPTLRRATEAQGTYPYTLELIGVYDDSRKRGRTNVWSTRS